MKREKGERRKKIGTTRQNTVEEGIYKKIPSGTLKQKYMFKKYYQMN